MHVEVPRQKVSWVVGAQAATLKAIKSISGAVTTVHRNDPQSLKARRAQLRSSRFRYCVCGILSRTVTPSAGAPHSISEYQRCCCPDSQHHLALSLGRELRAGQSFVIGAVHAEMANGLASIAPLLVLSGRVAAPLTLFSLSGGLLTRVEASAECVSKATRDGVHERSVGLPFFRLPLGFVGQSEVAREGKRQPWHCSRAHPGDGAPPSLIHSRGPPGPTSVVFRLRPPLAFRAYPLPEPISSA